MLKVNMDLYIPRGYTCYDYDGEISLSCSYLMQDSLDEGYVIHKWCILFDDNIKTIEGASVKCKKCQEVYEKALKEEQDP